MTVKGALRTEGLLADGAGVGCGLVPSLIVGADVNGELMVIRQVQVTHWAEVLCLSISGGYRKDLRDNISFA